MKERDMAKGEKRGPEAVDPERGTAADEPKKVTLGDDLLAALLPSKLTPFEGRDVIATTMVIKKAGDGLSTPLKFLQRELYEGEEVFVLLRTVVDDVSFPRIKDTQASSRKHVLTTLEATLVTPESAEPHFATQREQVQQAREEAQGLREREAGVQRLDDPDNGLQTVTNGGDDPDD